MAAWGSLDHIFDKPLPENPTLLESLSPWKHLKSVIDDSNYTEIFGELHFKENNVVQYSPPLPPQSQSSSPSSPKILQEIANEMIMEENNDSPDQKASFFTIKKQYRHSDGFSSMNSESLSLCTEGLGFESSDDVEGLKNEYNCSDFQSPLYHHHQEKSKRSRTSSKGSFPPPISCIGRTGKPWVHFKSYRVDGRFILQEIRIPTQESLHASREDGRLKLRIIQSDEENLQGDEDDDEDGSASDESYVGEINCEDNEQINLGEKVEKLSSNNVGG